VLEHNIRIRLNAKERFDVEEYCISEGWVKVLAGKTVDRRGRPLQANWEGRGVLPLINGRVAYARRQMRVCRSRDLAVLASPSA
jgi:hypothetical protein